MTEQPGLEMEPINPEPANPEPSNNSAPQANGAAEKPSPAPASAAAAPADRRPIPLSPEEYWKRKAAKYGWRQNTGNYARDHLANERTFLAWFRTSATFFSVGAVISKLTGVRNSVLSGVLLMALGGLVLLYAPYRYFALKRLMDAGYFRPNVWGVLTLVILTAALMVTILVLSLVPTNVNIK